MACKSWRKQSGQNGKYSQSLRRRVTFNFTLINIFPKKNYICYFLKLLAIKKYVVGLIIKNSSDEASLTKEKVYVNKLNLILIEILKYEWPKNWPSFISDIVGASKTNESVCQNNMEILKLLSEEVFDFSSGQMTQMKAKLLKESMNNEFQQVFQLCNFIMGNSQNTSLIQVTLETLLRFLNWIPLGYIFETQLIPNLINTFLIISMFRNVTLKCLTEIVAINVGTYQDKFVLLFEMTINTVKQVRQVTPFTAP